MNQPAESLSPEGEWYFSRDGQQSGPLSYDELKAKAGEGALMPRLDLVWKEGMTDWRPVGEIEGLFERNAPAAPVGDDPYVSGELDYDTGIDGEWPGARRRGYLIGIFIFPLLWNVVFAVAMANSQQFLGKPLPEAAVLALAFVPVAVALYYSIQRFPNLGMSRFWFLANFVPILNIWTGYRCFACPAGYAVQKKLDGAGMFLAILYWLFFVIAILAVVGLIAMGMGVVGNPDLQQKIREAMGPAIENFERQLQPPAK